MKITKTVHTGGVEHLGKSIRIFTTDSRKTLVAEINNWLFDYLFRSGKRLDQLPPLDDWTQSDYDSNYWSINFPNKEWFIWINSELLDFK